MDRWTNVLHFKIKKIKKSTAITKKKLHTHIKSYTQKFFITKHLKLQHSLKL